MSDPSGASRWRRPTEYRAFDRLRRLKPTMWVVVFILGTMCGVPSQVSALDPATDLTQCRNDPFGMASGLPPHAINAITQTPDGYMWLGTEAGLLRFDGVSFKSYENLKHFQPITALTVSKSGDLWYGTDNHGFGEFIDGKFKRKDLGGSDWSMQTQILQTQNGDMWLCAEGKYLAYRVHGNHVQPLLKYLKDLPNDCWVIHGAVEGPHGEIYCATPSEGLLEVLPNGTHRILRMMPPNVVTYPTSICRGRDGSIWIGTTLYGLWRYYGGKFHEYTRADGLPSNDVVSLDMDREGVLWIGTRHGLGRYAGGHFSAYNVQDNYGYSQVSALYEDAEGNLWVAVGTGLIRYANTRLTPLAMTSPANSIDPIYQVCAARKGGLWIAEDSGLRWWNNDVTVDYGHPKQAPNGIISAVHEAPDGTVGAISNFDTVYLLRGTEWVPEPAIKTPQFLFDDGKQLVAVAGTKLWRVSDGKLYSKVDLGSLGYINCAYGDSAGVVWIGGVNGLMRIQADHSTIYTAGLTDHPQVAAISPGLGGDLWVGTDTGPAQFHNGRFRLYTALDGLTGHNTPEVIADSDGSVWFGGDFGISGITARNLAAHEANATAPLSPSQFGATDGIRSYPDGPNHYSSCRMNDGTLCFQGENGITLVRPWLLGRPLSVPQVHIDDVVLNKDDLPMSSDSRRWISVPPGPRNVNIEYTGPSYRAPERIEFRYQLVGFDPGMVDAHTSRSANYTNLPPGTYVFKVTACNEDGVCNSTPASVAFDFAPFFYETLWFKLLLAILIIGLTAAAYRVRVRGLRLTNLELERKVAERTAELGDRNEELQDKHSELESQNEELQRLHETLSRANEQLEALATTDGLTGLKNHRSFKEHLDREWRQMARFGEPFSLIMLDVDQFKSYNDSFGHLHGDEILKEFASILHGNARDTDIVCRYGGEEFAILLPHTSMIAAAPIAERLRSLIELHPWPKHGITASFGVATATPATPDPESLIAAADAALYRSKDAGRNKVTLAERQSDVECQHFGNGKPTSSESKTSPVP